METKALIRKRVLEMRDGMPLGERSEKNRKIAERVMKHPAYRKAGSLLTYVSYKSEADTLVLIEHALKNGKKVYCPKVSGREMEFYRIASQDDLEDGYRGIREPRNRNEERMFRAGIKRGENLMLMPGSVFDKERNRIGYGGGYYDRYLETHTGLTVMALCYEMQVQERIPTERHDRKPDIVITECHGYESAGD
jgi:5,10-methenyltetrahydrofolate synthetase